MIEPDAVLEIADRVLDLGMAPMIGLEFEGLAVTVGYEGMEVVQREERELGTRGGPDAADDEPDGLRVLLRGERGVRRLSDVGTALDRSTGSGSSPPRGSPQCGGARCGAGGS